MTKVDFCKSNCTNKYQKKLLSETLYFYPQWMEKNNIFTSKTQITISFKNFIISMCFEVEIFTTLENMQCGGIFCIVYSSKCFCKLHNVFATSYVSNTEFQILEFMRNNYVDKYSDIDMAMVRSFKSNLNLYKYYFLFHKVCFLFYFKRSGLSTYTLLEQKNFKLKYYYNCAVVI